MKISVRVEGSCLSFLSVPTSFQPGTATSGGHCSAASGEIEAESMGGMLDLGFQCRDLRIPVFHDVACQLARRVAISLGVCIIGGSCKTRPTDPRTMSHGAF